jgi:pyruvate-formate lyase-activating enzyme
VKGLGLEQKVTEAVIEKADEELIEKYCGGTYATQETRDSYIHAPFITLSLTEPKPYIWITLSGCNFKCKGCFSIARDTVGEPMTVDGLINWVEKSIWAYTNSTLLEEAIITGGEPTLDMDFLLDLVLNIQ